jgi:D-beta-D-heptose 7-phosphate kinase/D-beta-D-heptose 1-phosphate adenosyltransferase
MTEPAPTAAHPAGFGRARVLVLGDVMLDRYVYGAVERVSYAAPIPVLAVRREEAMPGGAGNVAGLGATAILIGPWARMPPAPRWPDCSGPGGRRH